MIFNWISGKYWVHNFRHFFDYPLKSPESSLIPIFVIPSSIKALPTIIVLRSPDSIVEYVSISVVKLFGNAIAKFKKDANSP